MTTTQPLDLTTAFVRPVGARDEEGDQSPAARPAGERGETTIRPNVFATIAARAAAEVDGVGAVSRSVLGRTTTTADDPPASSADLVDGAVEVELTIGVRYPHPVWQVGDEVRRHVVDRLQLLTGHPVGRVDLEIGELRHHRPRQRRVV